MKLQTVIHRGLRREEMVYLGIRQFCRTPIRRLNMPVIDAERMPDLSMRSESNSRLQQCGNSTFREETPQAPHPSQPAASRSMEPSSSAGICLEGGPFG